MAPDPDSRAERTRTAILAAARAQFTETGYDGTGLRAIAGRAGVNVALISRYFGSKDGLFLAAIVPHLGMGLILCGGLYTIWRERAREVEVMTSTPMPASASAAQAAEGEADSEPRS